MYPPYKGIKPVITFEYHAARPRSERIRTIGLGDVLVKKPRRFRFVGCRRDPKHPGNTWFLFDVACDGKRIAKVSWRRVVAREPVEPAKEEPKPVPGLRIVRGEPPDLVVTEAGARFLRANYPRVLNDNRTRPQRYPRSDRIRGVLIVSVREGSVAEQLALRKDDVVLSIQGRLVTYKTRAVTVLREELPKGKPLEVLVLRKGKTLRLRYDARARTE